MPDTHPFVREYQVYMAPVATAGNSASSVLKAPFAGTVTAVTYAPAAGITGAATNNRTINVINKLLDGSGSANVASLNFASGVNATAFDEKVITLSGTPANLVVAAGDILQLQSLAVGTGIADPGGTLNVTFTRS